MSNEVVVVIVGGDAPRREAALAVPPGAPVIAADGGLEHARALGLEVAVAVGDFDSASPASVVGAEAAGTRLVRHPAEKDATDLELALAESLAYEPEGILVLAGGTGERLDHLVSLLLTLCTPRFAGVTVDALIGDARVHVLRGDRTLEGEPGELLSLLAPHGPAEGVTTEGLAYALAGETLEPGSSRGVSNVFGAATARITVERGVLLAIRPGPARGDDT